MQVEIIEYSKTAAALGELKQKYENVIYDVSTTGGMKDAVAARRELRDIRVGLEKMRKELKEPALRRCQLIDSEAKTITAQLVKLEDPIDTQIKAEERRKEELRLEAARREAERVDAIQKKIDDIRRLPWLLMAEPVAEIELELEALKEFEPGEEFAEFADVARIARDEAIVSLANMHAAKVKKDEEAARLAAEQEKLRAEREELERMRREIAEAKAAEAESAAKAAKALESAADKIAEEVQGTVTEVTFDQATSTVCLSFDLDGDDITGKPVLPQEIYTSSVTAALDRPDDDEIIKVLALHFRVHESQVITWLLDMDLQAASERMAKEFV